RRVDVGLDEHADETCADDGGAGGGGAASRSVEAADGGCAAGDKRGREREDEEEPCEAELEEDADVRVLRRAAEERVVAIHEHVVLSAEAVAGDWARLALVDRSLPGLPTASGGEEGALAAGIGAVWRAE